MQGGINAWKGLKAEGPPEAGMAYFSSAASVEEMAALAWILEDGNKRFYAGVSQSVSDENAKKLFTDLVTAEEHHKSSLLKLYLDKTGEKDARDFPSSVIGESGDRDVMEGGASVTKTLKWAEGKGLTEILELSMSLETNSYDLYLKMERQSGEEKYGHVFRVLAEEERDHLNRFIAILQQQP
jgi:rubrerythrin